MKNKTSFIAGLFFLIAASYQVSAQSIGYPLSDAIKYHDAATSLATKNLILQSYSTNLPTLQSNAFLDLTGITKAGLAGAAIAGATGEAQSGGGSSLGAPLINALTEVIVIRFKEELTLSFLNSFRKKLEEDTYLATLFPNAKLVLLNGNPFSYKVWLSSFRGALDNDLRLLPENLPILVNTIKDDPSIGLNVAQKAAIDTFMAAYVPALQYSKTPEKSYASLTQLLSNLSTINYANTNINAGILFSGLLTRELGNSTYSDWASKITLENLNDYKVCKTFIGLTIEKYATQLSTINVKDGAVITNLYDYLRALPVNRVNEVVQFSKNLTSKALTTFDLINELKVLKKTNEKISYESYIPLINQGLDILKMLSDSNNFNQLVPITGAQLNAFSDVVTNAQSCVTLITTLKSCIATKDYAKITVTSIAFVEKQIKQKELGKSSVMKEFTKYADLASNIAGAETSQEIVAAIEGAALPAQSYRLKRNSYFSITLNSYAGIFAGQEILQNSDAENKTAGVIGFTAPVGIALNWAINKKANPTKFGKYPGKTILNGTQIKSHTDYFSGQSFSIFAGIVDVGALAVYRLTDDETPADKINWQNIFAPGVHFIWGIGDTPLSLGASIQYGPELRKVTAEDETLVSTIESRAWRYGLSLTVDIPLLSFYAKTEKVE